MAPAPGAASRRGSNWPPGAGRAHTIAPRLCRRRSRARRPRSARRSPPRAPRLRRQERLRARPPRPLRRDRLRARRSIAVDALGPSASPWSRCPPHSATRARPTRGPRRAPRRRAHRDLDRRAMEAYERRLRRPSRAAEPGLAEENLQARIRGNLLMALSNKFGWLVLTTGNKSELSVGYATLYGDMAGGFAVIKDVYKLLVYPLVALAQRQRAASSIPASTSSGRPRPSCARISATRTPSPPTTCSIGSWRPTSSGRSRRREVAGPPGGRGAARCAHGRSRRVQAPPGSARHQDHDQGLRPRPAPADHEPLRSLRRCRASSFAWEAAVFAGYCAGDVGGERGGRARGDRWLGPWRFGDARPDCGRRHLRRASRDAGRWDLPRPRGGAPVVRRLATRVDRLCDGGRELRGSGRPGSDDRAQSCNGQAERRRGWHMRTRHGSVR